MKNRPVDGSPFMLRSAFRIGHDSDNHHRSQPDADVPSARYRGMAVCPVSLARISTDDRLPNG